MKKETLESLKLVLEYVLENEEEDFKEQLEENGDLFEPKHHVYYHAIKAWESLEILPEQD